MSDDVLLLDVAGLAERYRSGALSPVEVARLHLDRLERLEPVLNAFQVIERDAALLQARLSEARWQAGAPLGPLDGVPATIKDNVDVMGLPTRHGSTTTPDTPAAGDAPVVARLREAGAVFLGKTTLPEFGWKGITDSTLRGAATRNPWNTERSPGGSSGGATAALAAGIGTIAFGNDGGGSIRLPAAFSGVFGIKPHFGRVPHHVAEGLFGTVTVGGPITRSVADAAVALAVMARPDARDWHALPPPPAGWLDHLQPHLAGLRIAYAPKLGGVAPDAKMAAAIEAAVAALRRAGATITEVGPVFAALKPRFDAYWKASFAHKLRQIPEARRDELDPGYRRIAEEGMAIGLEAVLAGQVERARLHREIAALFGGFDLLLSATTPHAASAADSEYHTQGYDRWEDGVPYTLPFNLSGHPAASLPCGLTEDGLPAGLQVVGPAHGERGILEACAAMETVFGFRARYPALLAGLGK
jgi:aspartyl-tRNA(Asn)/glutamyl-tRNA(Gln) amidotransferase subunit A